MGSLSERTILRFRLDYELATNSVFESLRLCDLASPTVFKAQYNWDDSNLQAAQSRKADKRGLREVASNVLWRLRKDQPRLCLKVSALRDDATEVFSE